MLNITLKKADYAGWKDAYWIEYGSLRLILVPQVGGRIMGLCWQDRDLYWVNKNLANKPLDVNKIKNPSVNKVSTGFLLWGGDKTWLAPQNRWNAELPFLDLDSGSYELAILEHSSNQIAIAMTSPICRETGVQITRTVQLGVAENAWTVTHKIENCSDRNINWGIWGNTMLCRPATVLLSISKDSIFPDGVKTFIAEGDSIIARSEVVSWLDNIAAINCTEPIKFKYGVDSKKGEILAILPLRQEKFIAYSKQFPTFHSEIYGHGCVAEVFNAAEYPYLELEIHSPVRILAPDECFEMTETNLIVELEEYPSTLTSLFAN